MIEAHSLVMKAFSGKMKYFLNYTGYFGNKKIVVKHS